MKLKKRGNDPVRVGVVGAGYWGPNLIRNFSQIAESKVAVVCDLDESRLAHIKSTYPGIETTKDFRDVTSSIDVDAVCVATPVPWHFEITRMALENGKAAFVEKPITGNVEHAVQLVELADKNNCVLMVDHTFEYAPAVRLIKTLVDDGELGEIYYVSMNRLNLGLFQRDINVVWDLAPHDISILNYVFDQNPLSISAQGNCNIVPNIEDVAMLTLRYPENIVAYIQVSWLDPCKIRRATFVGASKMLVYDDVESAEKVKVYDKGVDGPNYYDTFGDFQFAYRYGDINTPYIENKEPLQIECQHFLDCIINGESPTSDGVDGLNVVRVLEAAQKSISNNGTEVDI